MAKLLLAAGETGKAASRAEDLIQAFPDRYMGYAIKALAAFKEGRYEDSLAQNRLALARAMPGEAEMVQRNIYAAYVRLQQFGKAYDTLLAIKNPMSATTSPKDLYDLALAALASGREREGSVLLELAALKTPATDAALTGEIEKMRRELQPGAGQDASALRSQ